MILNLFRYQKWRPIASIAIAQKSGCFFIADHFLCVRVEINGSSKPVRSIRQMHQRSRNMTLLNGRVQIRFVSAGHAIDEILKMSPLASAVHRLLLLLIASQPDHIRIGIFVPGREIALLIRRRCFRQCYDFRRAALVWPALRTSSVPVCPAAVCR